MTASINTRYVAFLASTAALGGLLFGFDIAIITGAGPFITREFSLSDIGLGWAFSSLLFGCVLGCFIAGRLADRYGRKKLLVIVAVLFAVTSIATALRNRLYPLCYRAFSGRAGRRWCFSPLSDVCGRGLSTVDPRPPGDSIPIVNHCRHHHILWHQLSSPKYRPIQLEMDVSYGSRAVSSIPTVRFDCSRIATFHGDDR